MRTQRVTDDDGIDLHLLIRAIISNPPRLGRKVEQRADYRRLFAGPQFQDLTEQSERVITAAAQNRPQQLRPWSSSSREELWRSRDDRIEPRNTDAHGDEREHVERAVLDRAIPRSKNGQPAKGPRAWQ